MLKESSAKEKLIYLIIKVLSKRSNKQNPKKNKINLKFAFKFNVSSKIPTKNNKIINNTIGSSLLKGVALTNKISLKKI
jgi:hypothetical protein